MVNEAMSALGPKTRFPGACRRAPGPAARTKIVADWYLVAILLGVFGYCLEASLIGLRTMLSVNLLTNY